MRKMNKDKQKCILKINPENKRIFIINVFTARTYNEQRIDVQMNIPIILTLLKSLSTYLSFIKSSAFEVKKEISKKVHR